MVGQGLAVLTGALLGTFITRIFTPEALDSWGWRVPFLFGLVIGPLGLYIRRRLDETGAFLAVRGARANNRRLGLRSPRMSDRCWQLSELSYPARSPSM